MAGFQAPADDPGFRNFREFLETYNKITETCFGKCVQNLNRGALYDDEAGCVDRCTAKNVTLNHRVLGAFMIEQPKIQEKKAEEAQKELEKLNAQVGGQQQEQDGGGDVGSTS